MSNDIYNIMNRIAIKLKFEDHTSTRSINNPNESLDSDMYGVLERILLDGNGILSINRSNWEKKCSSSKDTWAAHLSLTIAMYVFG